MLLSLSLYVHYFYCYIKIELFVVVNLHVCLDIQPQQRSSWTNCLLIENVEIANERELEKRDATRERRD